MQKNPALADYSACGSTPNRLKPWLLNQRKTLYDIRATYPKVMMPLLSKIHSKITKYLDDASGLAEFSGARESIYISYMKETTY